MGASYNRHKTTYIKPHRLNVEFDYTLHLEDPKYLANGIEA